ncbi:zinc finger protein 62 homolog isoform X1 [Haliotis rufescens]|uniref:zinc finger protein 62 homolog isoform X1 n=1 Tax=Haliotis rufescens TaxID=6454 RepID=UPI00201EAF31|nr:zinc finger protein 62 homolog isoform X1 [Haliotis rufescens]XP_048252088.1 zinc finger protein 62 homolog isoform X1 [Haliotis rufescens]
MVVFSHYQGNIMRSLYVFYKESYMCDTTLQAKDGEVKVHSLVLAACSEIFKAQITKKSNARTLWLSDLTLREVEMVVKVIYTGELQPQDTNTYNLKILKDWKVISEEDTKQVDHLKNSTIPQSDQVNNHMCENIQTKSASSVYPLVLHDGTSELVVCVRDTATEEYVLIDSQTGKDSPATAYEDEATSDVKPERSNLSLQVTRTSQTANEVQESSTLRRSIDTENVTVSILSIPSVNVTEMINEDNSEYNLHGINIQQKNNMKFEKAKQFNTSEEDNEQKSVGEDNVKMENTNMYMKLTNDGGMDCHDVDIVQEAYKTAMDMDPTDTDGATSVDSHEGEHMSGVTVSTPVVADTIRNITSNTDSHEDKSLQQGHRNVTDDDPRVDIDRCEEGKDRKIEVEGVVHVLRSKRGKRMPTIWKSVGKDNDESPDSEDKRGKRSRKSKHKAKKGKVKSSSSSSVQRVECSHDKVVGQCEVVEKGRHTWYGCPECGHQFKSLKLVAGHRYSKHSVAFDPSQFQVLKCQACDYETLEVHRLESHRVTSHSNTRPYVCEWCGKDFKLLGSLTLHTNTHTRARRFQCPLCDKVFSQHGARKRHVEEKHKKSHPHLCDVCPFSTLDRVTLVQHKYTKHSTPLPSGYTIYRCPEADCKFETFRRQVYTGHVNTHKGIQQYMCEVCHKKFSTAGNLRSHRIVHKEKSLQCPYSSCDFSTRLKNRLAQHVKLMHTHRDSKPHVCQHCPYKTAIKGNLLKHQRNVHRPRHNSSLAHTKGNNSDHKGENSVARQSFLSTTVLKPLLYSAGPIQLLDVTRHTLSDGEIIVNEISPQTAFDGATQVVLDIQP